MAPLKNNTAKAAGKRERKAARKLRSRTGESVAETLLAVLVAALALVMLAGAVTTASNVIRTSRAKMNIYNDNDEKMINMSEEPGSGSVQITAPDSSSANYEIKYYENAAFSQNQVVVYKKES